MKNSASIFLTPITNNLTSP